VSKAGPFVNSLGMKFVPVEITGGPTDNQRVLFSVWETRRQDYETFSKPQYPAFAQNGNHPVVRVNWDDAQAFCVWLTDRERKEQRITSTLGYRLPSDHEWSCAAGIGEREDGYAVPSAKNRIDDFYPWGQEWPPPAGSGNLPGEEIRTEIQSGGSQFKGSPIVIGYSDSFPRTAPVGSFRPNPLGLHDLAGNAWEWCGDWFDAQKKERVVRSSPWSAPLRQSHLSSTRAKFKPDLRYDTVGFRIVLAEAPLAAAAPKATTPPNVKPVKPSTTPSRVGAP
jgi:formylglycine-generating enzyme required for sulfatase activity